MKWEKEYTEYKKGDVLYDKVDIKAEGEYDDIVNDTEARAKMNKYGLVFGEQLKPDENVKLRLKTKDNVSYEATANVKELNDNKSLDRDMWDIKSIE